MRGRILSYGWSLIVAAVLLCGALLLATLKADAANEFVTTWKTNITNGADASLTVPTHPNYTYNYTVDWGDGITENGQTGSATHIYAFPGTYTVRISGQFPAIYFNNYPDREKIQSIDDWGAIEWQTMNDAFEGAKNLRVFAGNAPNLNKVNSLSGMFSGAEKMSAPIGNWDVSNVHNFSYMFYGAKEFNHDIGDWNTSNAQTFLSMFDGASNFNIDINDWDTSLVTSFNSMFNNASSFNQPLDKWDTQNVEDTRYMFYGASQFNQDISGWRLPKLRRSDYMFYGASNFDQDVSQWDIGPLQRAEGMFLGSKLSDKHYDKMLFFWSKSATINGVLLDGGQANYCNATPARDKLVQDKKWLITDGGQDLADCGPTDIYFEDEDLVLNEKQGPGSVIGNLLSNDPDQQDAHNYTLQCEGSYPDNAYFAINGNKLVSAIKFDFNNPQDANKDNVYQICVTSTDSTGSTIQKEFRVIITQNKEVEVTDGRVLGDTITNQNGNIGSNTPPPSPQSETIQTENNNPAAKVLAATSQGAAVLASTGGMIGLIVIVGIVLVGCAIYIKGPSETRRYRSR